MKTDERARESVAHLRRNCVLRRLIDELFEIRPVVNLTPKESVQYAMHRQRAYRLGDEFARIGPWKMNYQHGAIIKFAPMRGPLFFVRPRTRFP